MARRFAARIGRIDLLTRKNIFITFERFPWIASKLQFQFQFASFSRRRLCRNPIGILPKEISGEFCRGFFGWILFWPFSLEKNRRKRIHPKIHGKIQIRASRPKSTLQESALESFSAPETRFAKREFSSGTLNPFVRIGPSKNSLDGPNRQSPIASVQRTRSTLANQSAVPRGTNVKRMNANRAMRIAAQRTQGLWGLISVYREEIWPPTNASDSNRSDNSR